ncbi:hypothetical protein SK128_020695 [Halocaridina rubra]|uniref:Uncharacterized protein n=1 Tax=Halocaridina rubra TaxID=373956 RepID=A0AAN9AEC1_HALRR
MPHTSNYATRLGSRDEKVIKDVISHLFSDRKKLYELLQEATEGIYKQIWDLFDPSVGYVHSWDEGVAKVLKGRYVFLNAHLGAELRAKKLGLKRYYFARNSFYPQAYGIVCENGSPYREVFEGILIKLWSTGLVGKWTRDEVAKVKGVVVDLQKGPQAIAIRHLQAAFFLVIIGFASSFLAFVLEKLIWHCRKYFNKGPDI